MFGKVFWGGFEKLFYERGSFYWEASDCVVLLLKKSRLKNYFQTAFLFPW